MRIAYADPPYIGQAKKHYKADPRCAEVNHAMLISHLETFDGWALSLSSPSLKSILPLCPDDVRVMAWVKPFASFKKGVPVAYAWEPVIVKPARKLDRENTIRDWVAANITLRRGTPGAKPEGFCYWLFDVLGCEKADDFCDLFPGSGSVSDTWLRWQERMF